MDIIKIVQSKLFLVAVLALLGILLVRQHNLTNLVKQEMQREINNELALKDSVRILQQQNGQLLVEKSSLQLKNSELNEHQKKLVEELGFEKKKKLKPKTVIQYVTVYKEIIKEIPSTVQKDPDGKESIVFIHNPVLVGKNKLKIEGKVPYELSVQQDNNDPSKYTAGINPGNVSLNIEQNIDIITGIYQDPKTKRIMTRIKTEFPGLSFSEMNSFDITDTDETKSLIRSGRKPFGLGFSLAYGFFNGTGKPTWFVGAGINYNPKFLQFGK